LLTTDAKTEGKEKADGEEAGKERGSSGSETAPPKVEKGMPGRRTITMQSNGKKRNSRKNRHALDVNVTNT
jgi:hypothetical protein